jgi:hypothetical protein
MVISSKELRKPSRSGSTLRLEPLRGLLGPVGEDDVGAGAAEAGLYQRESVQSTEAVEKPMNLCLQLQADSVSRRFL